MVWELNAMEKGDGGTLFLSGTHKASFPQPPCVRTPDNPHMESYSCPGWPTDASWVRHPKVPMSAETARQLARLAELAGTPELRASPMPIAAQLLEDAVAQCPADPPPS